ncbi:MAG TPA: hypothetical protein VHO24_19565 [Opitutaceae bacterium]|nr:hypothetical protein [Opitutaceae bacterium]
MLRLIFFLCFVTPLLALAEDGGTASALLGRVDGNTYLAPSGAFKVSIPVLPELGGTISDTENVVTFQDDFNTHISIAAFAQDATQRWELSSRGLKDYLVYFFSNFVLSDFKQAFEGVQIESAKFVPALQDGSLITYILVPGGTMFASKIASLGTDDKPPVAKRGNLLFVKNGHIFVISIELAERIIEGRAYKKTTAEEDEILRQRLIDVVSRIQLPRPAAPAAAPTTTTTTTAPAK